MELELPSMPKFMVINIGLISAILLSAVIGIVILWQFIPILLTENVTNTQPEITLDIQYHRLATLGNTWTINGTATNTGNETLTNMKIFIHSDGNIHGDEVNISVISASETVDFSLKSRVKKSASKGPFTAQLSVTVPETIPAEYELSYTISDPVVTPTPTATPEATPSAGTSYLTQLMADGKKYECTVTTSEETIEIKVHNDNVHMTGEPPTTHYSGESVYKKTTYESYIGISEEYTCKWLNLSMAPEETITPSESEDGNGSSGVITSGVKLTFEDEPQSSYNCKTGSFDDSIFSTPGKICTFTEFTEDITT